MATTTFTNGVTLSDAGWFNDVDSVTYDGATTQVLVGGGAGVLAVWTTATGTGAPVRAGAPTFTSNITFSAASAKIIPGATNFSLRNNADSADNVLISDAGLVTIRAGATITAGGLTVTAGAATLSGGIASLGAQQAFTGTFTGGTTAPTGSVFYRVIGDTVIMDIPANSFTSNAITYTITGGPAEMRPTNTKRMIALTQDNGGAYVASLLTVNTTGVITFTADANGNNYTASGTKSNAAISVSYTLN